MAGMEGFISFNGSMTGEIDAGMGGGKVKNVLVKEDPEGDYLSVLDEEGNAYIDNSLYAFRSRLIDRFDYNQLTEEEKMNGTIYFIPEEVQHFGEFLDMTQLTVVDRQSSMSINSSAINQTVVTYGSGANVGLTYYYKAIDFTDLDTIKYDIDLIRRGYNNVNFTACIGVVRTAPTSGYGNYTNIPYLAFNHYYNEVGQSFTDEEIDVSNITGTGYILVFCPSWSLTIKNLAVEGSMVQPKKLMFHDIDFLS